MFLVRRASEIMDATCWSFRTIWHSTTFLGQPGHQGRMRHVVVSRDERIVGVLRVNTALRRGLEGTTTGASLGDVASEQFVIAHGEDIMFSVIGRMWRKGAVMTVVVKGEGIPRPGDVIGLITKEHVADSVAESIKPYSAGEAHF